MNESRRQTQLAELGIVQWYARRPLPGAAPSARFEFAPAETPQPSAPVPPVPSRPTTSQPPVQQPAPSGISSPAESRESLRSIRQSLTGNDAAEEPEEQPEAAKAAPEALQNAPPASEKAPRVNLCRMDGKGLSVMADFSDDFSSALQQALLHNLLRALECAPEQPELQRFRWPVFSNPDVPGNDLAGMQSIAAQFIGNEEGRRWLVLGAQSQQFLSLCSPQSNLWYVSARTLGALAADPAAKRSLWQSLREAMTTSPLHPES